MRTDPTVKLRTPAPEILARVSDPSPEPHVVESAATISRSTLADPISLAPISPLLLTERHAAKILSLSPRKVWELAACGAIPFVKIGTVKRYRRVDLEDWVGRGCPTSRQE
jgi:excisionase family DNA binding protein